MSRHCERSEAIRPVAIEIFYNILIDSFFAEKLKKNQKKMRKNLVHKNMRFIFARPFREKGVKREEKILGISAKRLNDCFCNHRLSLFDKHYSI